MSSLPGVINSIRESIALIVAVNSQGKYQGTGSGFVYSSGDILVTCNHVVKDADSLLLKFVDSDKFISAKIVIQDDEHDLAMLKFADSARKPLNAGDFSKVEEGMNIIFSGYPFRSKGLTTHQGIISAIIEDATGITTYTIDGTVNPGNSGCPLLNEKGEVIGVVNATRRNRADLLEKIENMPLNTFTMHGIDMVEIYQVISSNLQLGMGFAIPANYIPDHKIYQNRQVKVERKGSRNE